MKLDDKVTVLDMLIGAVMAVILYVLSSGIYFALVHHGILK